MDLYQDGIHRNLERFGLNGLSIKLMMLLQLELPNFESSTRERFLQQD
jgi:hypothetical protein